jgi:hypothetical protein
MNRAAGPGLREPAASAIQEFAMSGTKRYLDVGSHVIIVITVVLFVAALFIKGLGHDLLLEAGVFLVSVKLIVMTHKNGISAKELGDRLGRMEALLSRLDSRPDPGAPPGP